MSERNSVSDIGVAREPDISIVIPVFNRQETIERAVASALQQHTRLTTEVIVVNDGSTDETLEVLSGMANLRLRVVSQNNAGAAAARATGIRVANGRLIAFLDSDDYLEPHHIQTLHDALAAFPGAVLAYARVRADGDHKDYAPTEQRELITDPLRKLLEEGCFTVSMNLLVERATALFASEGRQHVMASNDYDFCLRAALRGSFVFVDSITMNIERRPDGISNQRGHQQVSYAILGSCEAAMLSGRKDEPLREALRYRVGLLWPSAIALCLRRWDGRLLMRVCLAVLRWGRLRDLKRLFWAIEYHSRQAAP